MDNLIAQRVAAAQANENPFVVTKMKSGWLVIGDVQPLMGYCVFLADAIVTSINHLSTSDRTQYSLDILRAGDALLEVTEAYRINYETLGNSEPALHTHIMPRYASEADEKRKYPAMMMYSWKYAPKFDPTVHGEIVSKLRSFLNA